MRKSNQILQNFFGKINDDYILNVLYLLHLILDIPGHKKRLHEILNISNPNITLDEFNTVIRQEIQYYESNLEENPNYLMEEIVTGKKINVIKNTPVIWCFIALYWAYDLKDEDKASIAKVYNPKIGDVALKFLLFFLRMKKEEARMQCVEHKSSFYEDLAARLVRIIDILPVMDAQNNNHLINQYFPVSTDLALNFLEVQINNHWENDALYVKEEKPKNTIRYSHKGEKINLIIKPSRMTKDGAFRDLDKTYNQLMKLYNLDLANSSTNYIRGNKQKSLEKEVLPSTIIPYEEELIYVDNLDPDIQTSEDKLENLLKSKVYRRDMKDLSDTDENAEEEVKEYVIPNAFQQHKRNVAFSSSLSKQKLLLESDYDIPTIQHLKAFIASLNTCENETKVYTSFFILNVALGCRMHDLLHLLEESKEGPFRLKSGVITVDIDSSLFAGKYSKLLSQSDDKLKFSLPITR
jgi:hypothetical protein